MVITGPVVQSWNEWDPLREVIMGTIEGKVLDPEQEPAVVRKFKNYDIFKWPITQDVPDTLAETRKLVENYAEILRGEGIVVHRPTPFDFSKNITNPIFDVRTQSGCTCPRDTFFVMGKHLIEAPMSWKCRYYENYAYRHVMMDYFNSDQRMRWSAAPKPTLGPQSFQAASISTPVITDTEILFDAADCRRFGKDVFVQNSHTCNQKGIDWIRRTLASDGVRVHEFEFEPCTFSHIDAKISPVDEDMMLWCPEEKPTQRMFDLFKENEWKLIDGGVRKSCATKDDMCGPGIHLNVLTIGPSKVCVEASEVDLIKTMRAEGIDVIPVPFAACYPYGGGLNCWTLDMHRSGGMKCYFPSLERDVEMKEGRP